MGQKASRPDGIEVWRVNSFTDRVFTGNPAGVVPEADGLSDRLMQSIAAELNSVSETAFITRPTVADADIQLRYFTSTVEVDLCGHATIAALFTLAWLGRVGGDDGTRHIRAQTRVGVLTLSLEFESGRVRRVFMEQLEPRLAEPPGAELAAEVLGLPGDAITSDLPVQCCSTGIWACFVPLQDVGQLARIRIQRKRIASLWPENPDFMGIYPFAFLDDRTTRGRFFPPPEIGILEDPVTGTACGALGGYLIANQRLPVDAELTARQGIEMGRPGSVRVRRNETGRMVISGQAVPVVRGRMTVDAGGGILALK